MGGHSDLESGVYYGWAGLDFHDSSNSSSSTGGDNVPAAPSHSDRGDQTASQQQHKDNSAATLADRVKNAGGKVAGAVGSALFGGSGGEAGSEQAAAAKPSSDSQEAATSSSSAAANGAASTPNDGHHVYPMAMSIGWNPFYKNTVRSVEVHIMHDFPRDFYGSHLNLVVLGFIRPEYDYVSKEALIDDIRTDIDVAHRSLARPAYAALKKDPYLFDFPKDEHGNVLKDDVAK